MTPCNTGLHISPSVRYDPMLVILQTRAGRRFCQWGGLRRCERGHFPFQSYASKWVWHANRMLEFRHGERTCKLGDQLQHCSYVYPPVADVWNNFSFSHQIPISNSLRCISKKFHLLRWPAHLVLNRSVQLANTQKAWLWKSESKGTCATAQMRCLRK